MKVIGIGKYDGEYQGYKFSKVVVCVEIKPSKKYKDFDGVCVQSYSCPLTETTAGVKVGDIIDLRYNRYGKIADVEILERSAENG